MSRNISYSIGIVAVLVACAAFGASGQEAHGTYTPYSIYGVGDLSQPGSAYNKTMGGVGFAVRNNRFINLMNPAAVTARDSLSFMVDFSVYGDNKVFRQGDIKSVSNTFNINDLAISFPIWRSSAMMVGIMPYSDSTPMIGADSSNFMPKATRVNTGEIRASPIPAGTVTSAM